MAVDKLVDSTQLDADLTSVANAIRTKGGTSATLAFPLGFVSAINAIQTATVPNLQAKTNINPTNASQTVTADNGYDGLASVQINAMPAGTAGTPTATKGTVSNHSVTVTPSVTNTTGYITGGTISGTAVTVDVTELESGTKSILANGTNIDVSGYSAVDVSVTSQPNLQVKTGIVPLSSSQTITADSGYDGLSSVQIDAIPTPNMRLIASKEVAVQTSSTTETIITGATMTGLANLSSEDNVVYVRVRDKAGKRAGYFYGSDTFCIKIYNESTFVTDISYLRATYRYTSNNQLAGTFGTTGYGIYPTTIGGRDSVVQISQKYNSSNSLTINGTYVIEVYLIDHEWTSQ